mmetsp:Transcript_37031/g.93010  ORF Transcript_37031/g.93010 Transcript_37031/m.93010 type:complete len:160 (+) Transcript_37031:1180-1659(+)
MRKAFKVVKERFTPSRLTCTDEIAPLLMCCMISTANSLASDVKRESFGPDVQLQFSEYKLAPTTWKELCARSDSAKWSEAELLEWETLVNHGVFEICDRPTNTNMKVLKSKWTWALKPNPDGSVKYKARLCACGDLQTPDTYGETFLPTSRAAVLRTLC